MKKTFYTIVSVAVLLACLVSCGKDSEQINQDAVKEAALDKKIQEIIADQYLDSLKKLGLEVNTGLQPPLVQGKFKFAPVILKATNVPADKITVGSRFLDSNVKLFGQEDDFSIDMIGENFIGEIDTSIITAISGSADSFTIYGKVKSQLGDETGEFALIMSGQLKDDVIANMHLGIICIKKSKSDTDAQNRSRFIPVGTGRLIYESDLLSERIIDQSKKAVISRFSTHSKGQNLVSSGIIE